MKGLRVLEEPDLVSADEAIDTPPGREEEEEEGRREELGVACF